jgi:rSAM/selenodomain-associated transferase 1
MGHAASATLPTMRRALLIVGKAPVPGRTKTRLVPPLSPEEAAALYRGFLLDCVDLGLELGWEQVSVIHPGGAGQPLAALLPSGVTLVQQSGHGLGDALSSAFERHFGEGFQRVVLIGSDNPTLPVEPIRAACAALDEDDLSIGPTVDGGYYLIGMRAAHLGVFSQIEWSTPRVFGQTLARAIALGLRVHTVQEWYDVDEPPDLQRLRTDLLRLLPGVAPNTRAALDRLSLTTLSH